MLGNNEKAKSTFGALETPIRTGRLPALVESTILTDGNYTITQFLIKSN